MKRPWTRCTSTDKKELLDFIKSTANLTFYYQSASKRHLHGQYLVNYGWFVTLQDGSLALYPEKEAFNTRFLKIHKIYYLKPYFCIDNVELIKAHLRLIRK